MAETGINQGTIASDADLRFALGEDNPSDIDAARLLMARQTADTLIETLLGYRPRQAQITEFYPKKFNLPSATQASSIGGTWDSNGVRATFFPDYGGLYMLQLSRLPVREIVSIHEDIDGRFGQRSGAFAADTELAAGDEYWAEYDQPNFSPSGLVHRIGRWAQNPGSLKIVYRAGYSETELAGQAYADAVDATTGEITTSGVNAYGIRQAAIMIAVKAFKAYSIQGKQAQAGYVAGALTAERLGDYSYQVSTVGMSARVEIPLEATVALGDFINYGSKLGGG